MKPIKLYNSLSRKKEEFRPIHEGAVGIYTCGPTVYSHIHVGNFRAYIFSDTLRRMFEYNGYQVKHVMNITDVGHLVSDADSGEDKLEKAARETGKTAWEIAEDYTSQFMLDLDRLNLKHPEQLPKATDHIAEQIDMVKKLEEKGLTYQISDGIYFDTSQYQDYGRLGGQKLADKEAGARVEENTEKKNPADFALWKFSPIGNKRQMEWESPWGTGFPGWHLECSAMSIKYLGLPFDIHTGGVDHLTVHHENELAQTGGAYNKRQANIWMHNEFLLIDGTKMSKSLKNLYTIDDIIQKGFDPLAYRLAVLGAHYRTQLNFTWESIQASQNALNNLYDVVRGWAKPSEVIEEYRESFTEAINNDLDTSKALAVMWEVVNSEKVDSATKSATLLEFDKVLGLNLDKYVAQPLVIPEKGQELVEDRESARAKKLFSESDTLREEIEKEGFTVEDTPDGPKIREKR